MAVDPQAQLAHIVLIGEKKVGKSALMRRFTERCFQDEYQPTEVAYWTQKRVDLDGVIVNVRIRDTVGADGLVTFSESEPNTGFLLLYDCTNEESFRHASQWLQFPPCNNSIKKLLVATKVDERHRVIATSQGQTLARKSGISFFETSAKTDLNVTDSFLALLRLLRTGRREENGGFTLEDIRQALALEIQNPQQIPDSTDSPPLIPSPDSPDSLLDDPEEIALVEENQEGVTVLCKVKIDVVMEEQGTQTEEVETEETKQKKKPGRPNPLRKKKEELDKFWLRQFRKYLKHNYSTLKSKMPANEKTFWKLYLSPGMKPDKDHQYKSYNKKYKDFLFSNPFFSTLFRSWFSKYGEEVLRGKFRQESEGYVTYYQHALIELTQRQESEEFNPDEMILSYE